jgi:hypothetical protein
MYVVGDAALQETPLMPSCSHITAHMYLYLYMSQLTRGQLFIDPSDTRPLSLWHIS